MYSYEIRYEFVSVHAAELEDADAATALSFDDDKRLEDKKEERQKKKKTER